MQPFFFLCVIFHLLLSELQRPWHCNAYCSFPMLQAREVIYRRAQEFKIEALRGLKGLFPGKFHAKNNCARCRFPTTTNTCTLSLLLPLLRRFWQPSVGRGELRGDGSAERKDLHHRPKRCRVQRVVESTATGRCYVDDGFCFGNGFHSYALT